MGESGEHAEKIFLKLGVQEAYDSITRIIGDRTTFNITESEPPGKIVAYGGRGPSKWIKAMFAPVIITPLLMHYNSPKRLIIISIKEIKGVTVATIRTEGTDSRTSTAVNTIFGDLESHRIDEMEMPKENAVSEDPLAILKTRYAKGEITEKEFEKKKKMLE